MRITSVCAVLLLMGVNGCATVWEPVHGRMASSGWSIQAPDGWMRFSAPTYDMFSKDGPYLQYILVQERPVAAEFKTTQQRIAADMLPHEMAQVVLDNLRSDPHIHDFTLVTNTPVRLGGRTGFKLVYTYQDGHGVNMKTIYYGTTYADCFFNLRYTAAQRHYFAADLDTFDLVLRSLRLPETS